MSEINRRKFLKTLLAGSGSLLIAPVISACQPAQASPSVPTKEQPAEPSPTQSVPTPTAVPPTETAAQATEQPLIPTDTALPQAAEPSGTPEMVVVRGPKEPEELVRRAIAGLGGMNRFVKQGANVIIKPNICVAYHTYEYAATTNPWVVGALVKLCLEAGAASVKVMDFPFGGTAPEAYTKSGIEEQVKAAGGEMAFMRSIKYVDTEIPQGVDLKSTSMNDDILKADVVINVPIAKTHGLARLTLGMKNMLGVVRDRPSMHWNLGQRLADITSRIRPALTVVDAIRILTANGPTGGNLDDVKKLDTIVASPDIVAADSYATSFFNMLPNDLDYIVAGAAMGLGKSDLSQVKIEEIAA